MDEMSSAFSNLKIGREAMGVDTIVGPHNTDAYINQAVDITEKQEAQGIETPAIVEADRVEDDEAS